MQGLSGGCGSGASSSSSSGSSSGSSSMAAVEQQLGVPPQELMQRLMARPDLLAKVQDPEVCLKADRPFNQQTQSVLACLVVGVPQGIESSRWLNNAGCTADASAVLTFMMNGEQDLSLGVANG